ncbi:MAG: APC family permease [Candidatus Sulfotelmatobacter sp.]
MRTNSIDADAAKADPDGHLKANALSLGDAIILGLASSAPAQTMAVALPALIASNYAGLLPIACVFVPMLGIALGYQRLNRWDQSAGATYTWVSKALHPYLGFVAGWMILMYYTLGTISMTMPAGTYTLQLTMPSLANNKLAAAAVGSIWNVLVTLLLLGGIEIAARFQRALAVFEYLVLFFFAILGIRTLLSGHAAVKVTSAWFSLSGSGGARGFMAGALIAVFMYSGWDAAIYVNQETKEKETNPGRAAIASVVILLFVYGLITFAYQGIVSRSDLQSSAGNALAVIANRLLPGPSSLVLSLVVLLGTVACLQVAVVSSSRLGFAMAEGRVMPRFFKIVHPRTGSPWAVTLFMGGMNLVFLALTAFEAGGTGEVLSNIAGALGIIASLFYALTAIAAVWQYRAVLLDNTGNFVLGGLWPTLGAIFLLTVVVEAVLTRAVSTAVLWAGLGATAVALPVALGIHYIGKVPLLGGQREQQLPSAD